MFLIIHFMPPVRWFYMRMNTEHDNKERGKGMLGGETGWGIAVTKLLRCFIVKPDESCCSQVRPRCQVLFHKTTAMCV